MSFPACASIQRFSVRDNVWEAHGVMLPKRTISLFIMVNVNHKGKFL